MAAEAINKLSFTHGQAIEFEYLIQQRLQIEDVIVVLLEVPPKIKHDLNVLAFSTSGDFLWRIKETPLFYSGNNCPYVEMIINNNQQLVLFNWCDTAVIVEVFTGEILDKYLTK